MPLTDTQIKNINALPKTSKHFDGGGLYIEVPPTGKKRWRLKYRFGGKEQLLSLGTYPEIRLKCARDRRDDARRLLASGINPSSERKAKKAAAHRSSDNTFEVIAHEWMIQQKGFWTSGHLSTVKQRLKRHVFPVLGNIPIDQVSVPNLLAVLRPIEKRDTIETAHRVRGIFGQIFRYAISTGRLISDPSRDLRGALAPVKK